MKYIFCDIKQDIYLSFYIYQTLQSMFDNNNNIFAIVQSTFSDLLKDSNPLGLE